MVRRAEMSQQDKRELVDEIVRLERYLIRHPQACKENGGGNCVELPFTCGLCKESRFDLQMIDGDGLPLCIKCVDRLVDAMSGKEKEHCHE